MKGKQNFTSAARAALMYRDFIVEDVERNADAFFAPLRKQWQVGEKAGPGIQESVFSQLCNNLRVYLRQASLRYWETEIQTLARNKSEAFFGLKIEQEWVPQSPVLEFYEPHMQGSNPASKGIPTPYGNAVGILFAPVVQGDPRSFIPINTAPLAEQAMTFYIILSDKMRLSLAFASALKTGEIIEAKNYKTADLCAECVFLQQRLGVPEREFVNDPNRSRRLKGKPHAHEPEIFRILLRRKDYPSFPSPKDESDFAYSCRFMVTGHWRQQYYPSTDEHKPKFIFGYLKGPENAPLKVRIATVEEARR